MKKKGLYHAPTIANRAGETKNIKIHWFNEKPVMMFVDTPGLFPPRHWVERDIENYYKLGICGKINPSDLRDPMEVAEYLLFRLNHARCFEYVSVLKLKQPTDDVKEFVNATRTPSDRGGLQVLLRYFLAGQFGTVVLDDLNEPVTPTVPLDWQLLNDDPRKRRDREMSSPWNANVKTFDELDNSNEKPSVEEISALLNDIDQELFQRVLSDRGRRGRGGKGARERPSYEKGTSGKDRYQWSLEHPVVYRKPPQRQDRNNGYRGRNSSFEPDRYSRGVNGGDSVDDIFVSDANERKVEREREFENRYLVGGANRGKYRASAEFRGRNLRENEYERQSGEDQSDRSSMQDPMDLSFVDDSSPMIFSSEKRGEPRVFSDDDQPLVFTQESSKELQMNTQVGLEALESSQQTATRVAAQWSEKELCVEPIRRTNARPTRKNSA